MWQRNSLPRAIDPNANKQAVKTAAKAESESSYEVIAREWYAKYAPTWTQSNAVKVIARQVNDAYENAPTAHCTSCQAGSGHTQRVAAFHLPEPLFISINEGEQRANIRYDLACRVTPPWLRQRANDCAWVSAPWRQPC
jgi:hypothetical protein